MPDIDPLQFRQTLGRFATGVCVVTSRMGDDRHGMTVNAFSSVSLKPPLVLFCATNGTRTLALIEAAGLYAVNILGQHQVSVSERFAGRQLEDTDRFAGLDCREGVTGCPLIEGAVAWIECKLVSATPAGDHTILLGEVQALAPGEGHPLLYFSRQYHGLAPFEPG